MKNYKNPDYPTLEQLKKGTKTFTCAALATMVALSIAGCGKDKETTTELVLDGETQTETSYILEGEVPIEITYDTELAQYVDNYAELEAKIFEILGEQVRIQDAQDNNDKNKNDRAKSNLERFGNGWWYLEAADVKFTVICEEHHVSAISYFDGLNTRYVAFEAAKSDNTNKGVQIIETNAEDVLNP